MNLRNVLLAFAAIGLVTMGFGASVASADTEVPPDEAYGNCYYVYFFVIEAGPVTVDASDSCWQVIVEDQEECETEENGVTAPISQACRDAIREAADDTCDDATPKSVACALDPAVASPCEYIQCTCFCDPPYSQPALKA